MANEVKTFFTADTRQLFQSLDSIEKKLGSLSSSTDLFNSVLGGNLASRAISEVTSAALSGAKSLLEYSANLEQARIGLTTITGSAIVATKHLKDLQDFAKTTPFEFSELVAASQKLQGVGFNAAQVIPVLKDVGSALSASGRIGDLPFAIKALGDIQAKGKLAGQEIIQLANAGLPAIKILSSALNKTSAEVLKLSESGNISSEVFLNALRKYSESNFGGALEAQSKTFRGAISNISDALGQTSEVAFRPLFQKVSSLAVELASEVGNSGNDLEAVGGTIAKYIGTGLGLATTEIAIGFGKALAHEITTSGKDSFIDNLGFGFANEIFPEAARAIGALTDKEVDNFKRQNQADFNATKTGLTTDEIIAKVNKKSAATLSDSSDKLTQFKTSIYGAKNETDTLNSSLSETKTLAGGVPKLSDKLGTKEAITDVGKLSSFIDSLIRPKKTVDPPLSDPSLEADRNRRNQLETVKGFFKPGNVIRDILTGVQTDNENAAQIKQATKTAADIAFELDQKKANLLGFTKSASKRFSRNPNFEDANFNLTALNSIKEFLPTDAFEDFSDKLSDFIKKDIEKSENLVKEFGKTAASTFSSLYQSLNRDNPIAQIFADGRKELESLAESIRGLSPELQAQALAMQSSLNANALFSARLDNKLGGLDLREDADSFRNFKQPGIKDAAKFFEDFISAGLKQISTETGGTNVRFNRLGSGGFSQSDARNDLLRSYDRVSRADGSFGGFSNRARTFADLTQKEKDEFIRSSSDDNNLKFQQRLDRQVFAAQNSNALNDDQKRLVDRKLISLTQGVDPSKLTESQRDVAAQAREREAERLDRNEQKASAQRDAQIVLQTAIAESNAQILQLGLTKGSGAIDVILKDQTGGSSGAELQRAATQADVQRAYDESYTGGTFLDDFNRRGR